MTEKVKFDQEAAFKSIIAPSREQNPEGCEKPAEKEKTKTACNGRIS